MKAVMGPLPDNYIIIDTETCGLEPREDYVLQLGQVIVKDRQVVHQAGLYLDWVRPGILPEQWLRNRMAGIADNMARHGAQYRVNFDVMMTEGVDARSVINEWASTIKTGLDSGMSLVGHNIASYDLVMLSRHVVDVCKNPLLIPGNAVCDTGMLEKARQINMAPSPGENMVEWFWRVYAAKRRVKWKLDGHCADQYDLWVRSGLNPTLAHDAVADCVLTYHLLEAMREFLEPQS